MSLELDQMLSLYTVILKLTSIFYRIFASLQHEFIS